MNKATSNTALQKTAIVSLIFSIIFSGALYAAPSNGTRFPAKKAFEVGYEFNSLQKRSLDRSYGNLSSTNNFITVSFGATDWLVLDGKIGLGDVTQKGGIHLPKIEYGTSFAGGYGFRIKLFDDVKTGFLVIVGGQHISVHPEDRSVDDDKFESFLDDWQMSGVVTKRVGILNPYVGIKLSDCEIIYKINKNNKKRRFSENHIGFLFGSDIYFLKDKLRVNIEARFFDETAFSTGVAYLF